MIGTLKDVYGGASIRHSPNGVLKHEMSPSDQFERDDVAPVGSGGTVFWVHGRDLTSGTVGWVAEHLFVWRDKPPMQPPDAPNVPQQEPRVITQDGRPYGPPTWLWITLGVLLLALFLSLRYL